MDKLADSNVDIIECGFLKPHNKYNNNLSLFDNLSRIENVKDTENKTFCVMLIYGDCNIEDIPSCNGGKVKTIRVSFHKEDANNAMAFCKALKSKGYDVFVQPVSTFRYSDEELRALVKSANEFLPKAFYMVDTCGVMDKEAVARMFNIIDEDLDHSISIGFHSHNNLQLSFSNAQELLNLDTQRDIIIDSSVFGMGRGAGNLCTELLMQNLNERFGEKYDLNPIYKIFDEHLSGIFEKTPWGYSMPLFISAKHKCHPNYVMFLNKLGISSANALDKIVSKIAENKKTSVDQAHLKTLYNNFLHQRQYEIIAFDVDGTLIDSSEGVNDTIRYVEQELDITPINEESLKFCIGPPLKYVYGVLHGLNGEDLEKAMLLHKKYMSEKGYKKAKLYDGIETLLKELKNKGIKLTVATLKQESIAKKVLEVLGIDKYFDLIKGQNPTEDFKKSDLLNQIKEKFSSDKIVLVGDSKFDGEAANEASTDFVAVTYGFGFKNSKDAEKYSPVKTCNSLSELENIL